MKPNPENLEVILNAIHAVLPIQTNYNKEHFLYKEILFSSSFEVLFSKYFSSNPTVIPYYNHYYYNHSLFKIIDDENIERMLIFLHYHLSF